MPTTAVKRRKPQGKMRERVLFGVAAALACLALVLRGRRRRHVFRRAALDIGSGQHKLLVADVDTRAGGGAGQIVRIVHAEQVQVLLGHDLVGNGSGALSDAILSTSRQTIARFKSVAQSLGADGRIVGVATAVFRRAENGPDFLDSLTQFPGVSVRVVTQDLEGRLGFLSALASRRAPAAQLIAWDSGAGSFQLSAAREHEHGAAERADGQGADGRGVRVHEGHLGDSDVTQMLVERVQGLSFAPDGSSSPNPVSAAQARSLVAQLRIELPPPPTWLAHKATQPGVVVVGIGERTSIFFVAAAITGRRAFTREDVWRAVERVVGRGDAELASAYPLHEEAAMAVPKLCLLYAVMEAVGLSLVHYAPTMGSCEGVLLTEELWQLAQPLPPPANGEAGGATGAALRVRAEAEAEAAGHADAPAVDGAAERSDCRTTVFSSAKGG